MHSDITVACVFWKGRFRGRDYTPEWVEKLKNMVSRNFSIPHRFVCFSNVEVPVERIPLRHNLPGWWSKLELFDPDNRLRGRILYIDLDVVIVDDLSPIVDYPSEFAIVPHFHPSMKSGTIIGNEVVRYNSSVMVWNAGAGGRIWKYFKLKDMALFRGDQDWIASIMPDLDTFPKRWVTKLRFCPDGPPPDAKVILVMPGKNEKAARRYRWIKELWI